MPNTNTAIESLRTFAMAHNEIAFAHLCTAAIEGEEWAMERIADGTKRASVATSATSKRDHRIAIIRSTDTARPDGAIARTLTI